MSSGRARDRRHPGASGWLTVLALAALTACGPKPTPAKQYPITGQILAIQPDRLSITLKHEDIPNFMPAMTMTYRLATPELMKDRAAGETIVGTLEVTDTSSQLTSVTHTGTAPIPENTNEIALASGILSEGDEIPDAALVDERDRRFSVAEWKGRPTLVTFIYTSCPLPEFCPRLDERFSDIQARIAKDGALGGQVRLVSVSFDPAHDTPAALAAHAKKRRADPAIWTFATGDARTIDRFAGRFGVSVIREKDQTITHTLRTFLIGKDGRVRRIYSGTDWQPDAVMADIRQAVAGS